MNIKVTKLTNIDLLHKANSFTTGKESKQSLKSAYRCKHSTIRTQIFLVECYGIPQSVAYHLRTHFTLYPMPPEEYPWMRSKRPDKCGVDFGEVCDNLAQRIANLPHIASEFAYDEIRELADTVSDLPTRFGRTAPTDFGFLISAEGLMTMAEKRLCIGAVSKETREVVEAICQLVEECDPDLYPFLVKPCILTGNCRECKCCGYIHTDKFREERKNYKSLFKN